MQNDLLTELHLPELDFKSLKNIVTQNSARLANLIKESNECLDESEAIPLPFKEPKESMVSDFTAIGYPKDTKNLEQEVCVLSKSLISNHNAIKNKDDALLHSGTGNSVVESIATEECKTSNITQGCNAEDKSIFIDSPQFSQNCSSINETSPKEIFKVIQSSDHLQNKPLVNSIGSSCSEEKTEDQLSLSEASALLVESSINILNKKSGTGSHPENVSASSVVEKSKLTSDSVDNSDPAFCVISEVIGNANDIFSEDNTELNLKPKPDVQIITPKKTNDITKIKGWRRKQFFVEKPTTVEFYSNNEEFSSFKKDKNLGDNENIKIKSEESENVESAFVCHSLDDFLDRESELKISYEIPHLYAEFGIKLTRSDIVSKPNLSEEDIKEVETRYCVPISLPCDTINLDEINEENIKGVKRSAETDTKISKIIKLDENKKQPVKSPQKQEDKLEKFCASNESKNSSEGHGSDNTNETILRKSDKAVNNIKLVNKLIALVVYPGPYMPLHPIVQFHLSKIRSYRTKIDKNWASFAASAVLNYEKPYERKILPAHCCAKIKINPINNDSEISRQKHYDCAPSSSKLKGQTNIKSRNKKRPKLKSCCVVLEKLDYLDSLIPWCMDHNCYNCVKCGLEISKLKNLSFRKKFKKTRTTSEDPETIIVSPQASFDKKVASLLAKKVRLLKVNGDTLKSIDCLKTLAVNIVEFIKLKFVKESFLSGYLNIWYLKPEEPNVRFRAFLTFSHTPPLPNAINLKSNAFSLKNLPKVITEIVSTESTFDSNEYAILHCDGKIWEIHGSLNIAFGKCNKNIEQIFTSAELPELKILQKIALDTLNVKATKWWVLDLTQQFRHLEVSFGKITVIVTRKKFIASLKINPFGFWTLRKNWEGRILGVLIMSRLLPFVLIGPYYLLEANDLVLMGEKSSVPFMYYGEEKVSKNSPLKFFINSVISNIKKCGKSLEGLWLYDKMCLDSTSYLEVMTTKSCISPPNEYSTIDIEHGYSLNSLTNSSPAGMNPGVAKRKDGREVFKKITVYLYFDIFELGFVEGELQFDNSVIISHPLDKRTKMKSNKIGDWFIGIIKRRIEFIPKDLVVRWFITKFKDDLRQRRPFNKFYLGGAHILTKNGVFYLLEMSDSKIEKLGIDRKAIVKAISQSEVIREVKELKNLSNLLVNDPNKSLTMFEVLTKASREIKALREAERTLKVDKFILEIEKLSLCSHLIDKLNRCRISFYLKIKIIEKLEPLFREKNGNLNKNFVDMLQICGIGRKYLKRVERKRAWIKAKEKELQVENTDKSKSEEIQTVFNATDSSTKDISTLNSFSGALNVNGSTIGKRDPSKYTEVQTEFEKLAEDSNQFTSLKNIYSKILESPTSMKECLEESETKEKIKNTIHTGEKSPNDLKSKNEKFIKLSSSELPNNIKLCWKN